MAHFSTDRFSLLESMFAHLFKLSCFLPVTFPRLATSNVSRKHYHLQTKKLSYTEFLFFKVYFLVRCMFTKSLNIAHNNLLDKYSAV